MLARRYGGQSYEKVASKIIKQDKILIKSLATAQTHQSPRSISPIKEEKTVLVEVPFKDKKAHEYLESLNF